MIDITVVVDGEEMPSLAADTSTSIYYRSFVVPSSNWMHHVRTCQCPRVRVQFRPEPDGGYTSLDFAHALARWEDYENGKTARLVIETKFTAEVPREYMSLLEADTNWLGDIKVPA